MDLKLWAQLNLIGHVTYQDYLLMSPDEAMACLKALTDVIEDTKKERERESKRAQTAALLEGLEQRYANKRPNS